MYGTDYDKKKHTKAKIPYRLGSFKNQIIASDLVEERANCNYDKEELANFLDILHQSKKELFDLIASMPETRNNFEFYEMSTEEK